ncbi:MAG: peptidase C39 family protein, partial [Actinobacteria bacterium]|nr:peptidase C39 family protein [Actinomycetota bacterium]
VCPGVAMLVTTAVLLLLSPGTPGAEAASSSYVDFARHDTYEAFSAGEQDGVTVDGLSGGAGEVRLDSAPYTGSDGSGFYNGGSYYWGWMTSPVYGTATPFDTLVPSWEAVTPAGTWVELEVRVHSEDAWSPWFDMGVWSSETGSVGRHSVNGQWSGAWEVLTDTLQSNGLVFADAYQYRLTLFTEQLDISPLVRGVSVAASDSYRHGENLGVVGTGLWGQELEVPAHSQMVYPDGGEIWCSPTSLSMVMAYWASQIGDPNMNQSVPVVAASTYDYAYQGWGNWPFNTAYASSYGLKAAVSRFSSIEQVEWWIEMGIPVVTSIAWDNRYGEQQLSGAPLTWSDGHLLVIRGFDSSGNVIVNDPAGSDDSQVRRVYDRDEFARAWFSGSGGIVYLIYPNDWSTPDRAYAQGSW